MKLNVGEDIFAIAWESKSFTPLISTLMNGSQGVEPHLYPLTKTWHSEVNSMSKYFFSARFSSIFLQSFFNAVLVGMYSFSIFFLQCLFLAVLVGNFNLPVVYAYFNRIMYANVDIGYFMCLYARRFIDYFNLLARYRIDSIFL